MAYDDQTHWDHHLGNQWSHTTIHTDSKYRWSFCLRSFHLFCTMAIKDQQKNNFSSIPYFLSFGESTTDGSGLCTCSSDFCSPILFPYMPLWCCIMKCEGLQYLCLWRMQFQCLTISVVSINLDAVQAVDWKVYITVAFPCYFKFLTVFTSRWGVNVSLGVSHYSG